MTEEQVDVVICGSGSAGLACAVWLAIYNDRYCRQGDSSNIPPITYRILESRNGPLQVGQADGVQCRTVEIFESLGLDHTLKAEGYWVNEVSFWAQTADEHSQSNEVISNESKSRKLVRTGRTPDVQPGLSHQPHIILNQARINGLLLEKMIELNGTGVEYGWKITHVASEEGCDSSYPVKAVAEKAGKTRIIRAKYALGGDGAHSQVRHSLQIAMEGDSTNAVWGVMDVFPSTGFPDFRKKATIRSDLGTLMIIPREGDAMIRMYFELPTGTNPKTVTLNQLHARAKDMFQPFNIDFLHTKWWSAYAIGQRVARSIVDPTGHVFLAGDACHTHSPKAGQGMNASLQDGYNIGWKLGALLTRQTTSLLNTYVHERHEYARKLIDFDRYFASLFAANSSKGGDSSTQEFSQAFIKAGIFTAGMAANYSTSTLSARDISRPDLAAKVVIGERLPSPQVVRMSDSKPFPLLKLLQSDGRWRIIIFPGNVEDGKSVQHVNKIGEELASKTGLLAKFTPPGKELDHIIDTLVVMQGDRQKLEFDQLHDVFKPKMHELPVNNLHKIFFDDQSWNWGHGHAYQTLQIDPEQGCIIVARPDQYVSAVIGLNDLQKLTEWFSTFIKPAN